MCAIVGVVDYAGRFSTPDLQKLTESMRDTMAHRGPDDAGLWTSPDGRVVLGQRRLSIIDLRPEGHQPMLNEDGRVAVTFNGEIYNFQGLRQTLESQGHHFKSRTDTEVLCHLFESDPLDVVNQLSGMFAFGIWREQQKELVLARDHFGKKPLYFVHFDGFLAFASELQALEKLGSLVGDVDSAAVQEYLLYQYIPAPRTIYKNVQKLEAGTIFRISFQGRSTVQQRVRFYRFEAQEPAKEGWSRRPLADYTATAKDLILQATRDRLVADVPLGAFLSGGNDSSLVVALMARELGMKVKTFSIGFANSPSSEHPAARQIAQHLGTDHHEYIVDPSAVDLLPTIVKALDEPNGDSSCLPVYLLSEFARKHVTVVLSGDGGDEMFGGYGRYTHTMREASLLGVKHRLGWLRRHRHFWRAGQAYWSERILPMTDVVLEKLAGRLDPAVAARLEDLRADVDRPGPVLHHLRTADANHYMPGAVLAKVDRMSMQFALEVRSPLLDTRVAAWARTLPAWVCNDGQIAKKVLKELCLQYLPREIVYRPKQGFGVPDQCWSQDRLLGLAEDLLLGSGSRLTGHLDRTRLKEHLAQQRQANSFHVYQVWEMLVLEQWLRTRTAQAALPLAA